MSILGTGTHTVTITATALTTAKSGTDQIRLDFADEAGNTIADYLALTPKAWPYTLEKLRACGWHNETDVELLAAEPSPLVGQSVEIVVTQESDGGFQPRNRVKFYKNSSRPREGQRSPDEIGARLRASIGGTMPPKADNIPW